MAKGKVLADEIKDVGVGAGLVLDFGSQVLDLRSSTPPLSSETKHSRPNTVFLPYNLARNMLITSSDVMTPVSRLWSSTTGRVWRLYLSNSSATSFSSTPSCARTSGSWMSESMGVEGCASTNLASGNAAVRVA